MPLKLRYKKIEEIPETARGFYTEVEGEFVLQTEEPVVDRAKLDEFRANNINLMKELKELKEMYKGVDPEKYKQISKQIQDLEDKKLLDAGKVEELLNQKTEKMKNDYETRLDAISKAKDESDKKWKTTEEQLSKILIDSELTKAVSTIGVPRQGALLDILNRGREVWTLIDGVPTPVRGGKALYGKDGKSLLSFTEWAEDLYKDASFLFEPSKGSGAIGGGDKGKVGLANDLRNLPPSDRLKEIHRQGIKK